LVARGWDPAGASVGTRLAQSFTVNCQKQGADFVATRTIQGSFEEVVVSPGVTKPKVCHYYFGGAAATLASPTECNSGTCVEVYDSCGTGTAPSWATVSEYNNIIFAAGTYASSSPVSCKCQAYDSNTATTRTCDPFFVTSDQSWSSDASGGFTTNLLTSNTAYIQLRCEGQAP
jgi:hypothetical protein